MTWVKWNLEGGGSVLNDILFVHLRGRCNDNPENPY
jgi:hypothetical protein